MTRSAGLLVYRFGADGVEFLLAHPGGPFWSNKDNGAWTIPKGLIEAGEDPLTAARREFREETGQNIEGSFVPLTPLRQKSGKTIECWMIEAALDLSLFSSATVRMEWPRRSGRILMFPELDRVAYLPPPEALRKILPGQAGFLREALSRLAP